MTSIARGTSCAATIAIASLLAGFAAGCAGSKELTCADMVLVDWNNGRLGNEYAPECYRDALEALPEDVRVYTTAADEIKRALRASITARARRESEKKPGREQAAATGRASRRLSGWQRDDKPAPAGAEAETAPARGAQTGPTSLPLPVALTVTLILVACAGGVTRSVARRLRARRLARRDVPGPL